MQYFLMLAIVLKNYVLLLASLESIKDTARILAFSNIINV